MNWINAKDRKPEGRCLVYLSEEMLGNRIHSANFDVRVVLVGGYFLWDCSGEITHWMPLPDPPMPQICKQHKIISSSGNAFLAGYNCAQRAYGGDESLLNNPYNPDHEDYEDFQDGKCLFNKRMDEDDAHKNR